MARSGYVYALSNEAVPGVFKVGRTVHHPRQRLRAINGSLGAGLEMPLFALEFFVATPDCSTMEKRVHHILDTFRIRDDREFFRVPENTLIDAMERVTGKKVQRDVDGAWPWGGRTLRPSGRPGRPPSFHGQPRVVWWLRRQYEALVAAERVGPIDWTRVAFDYGRLQEEEGGRFCPPPPTMVRLSWERAKELGPIERVRHEQE